MLDIVEAHEGRMELLHAIFGKGEPEKKTQAPPENPEELSDKLRGAFRMLGAKPKKRKK